MTPPLNEPSSEQPDPATVPRPVAVPEGGQQEPCSPFELPSDTATEAAP